MESVNTCSLYEKTWENSAKYRQRTEICFGITQFLLENITLLCLQFAKLFQLDCKKTFGYSLCLHVLVDAGTGNVKSVVEKIPISVNLVQIFLWYFFVKWRQFSQAVILFFNTPQLIFVRKVCRINFSVVYTNADWLNLSFFSIGMIGSIFVPSHQISICLSGR